MYRTNLTCVNFYFIRAHLDIFVSGYAVRRVCSNPTIEKILSTFARMNERTMCLHKCRPKHIKKPDTDMHTLTNMFNTQIPLTKSFNERYFVGWLLLLACCVFMLLHAAAAIHHRRRTVLYGGFVGRCSTWGARKSKTGGGVNNCVCARSHPLCTISLV